MKVRLKQDPTEFTGVWINGEWEWKYGIELEGGGYWPIPWIELSPGAEVDEIKVKIVPFPYSEVPKQRGMFRLIDIQKAQFMYCLRGWEGIFDEDGNPVECNDENKEILFDIHQPLRQFVLQCVDELAGVEATILKN